MLGLNAGESTAPLTFKEPRLALPDKATLTAPEALAEPPSEITLTEILALPTATVLNVTLYVPLV